MTPSMEGPAGGAGGVGGSSGAGGLEPTDASGAPLVSDTIVCIGRHRPVLAR